MYTERYKSHHDAARSLKEKYTRACSKKEYVASVLSQKTEEPRVIYIHVPFCNKVCSFCPFHRPDELDRRSYHEYLMDEIRRISDFPYMQAPVAAVNFGGGTPTALLPEQMERVLTALRENFTIADGAEISVETSCTELTEEMLLVLKDGGVNRLSVGVQSFDGEARRLLGRRGDGERAVVAVQRALKGGIVNTGIDLIYNYPGQTEKRLLEDLRVIRDLGVAGISFYSLMLHEKTPLYRNLSEKGMLDYSKLDKEYGLYSLILDTLEEDGFRMLELTKLVRDGIDKYQYMELRHSVGNCIAIGHGAGGNLENYIYHNSVHSPVLSEKIPVSAMGRVVCPEYRILDALIYEMQKGKIAPKRFSAVLGQELGEVFWQSVLRMEEEGLLNEREGEYTFTKKGSFWGNNIIDELVRCLL